MGVTGGVLTNFQIGIFVSEPVSFRIDHRDCNGRMRCLGWRQESPD